MDAFGHKLLAGTARFLANKAAKEIGCKTRAIEFSTLQRCASHIVSRGKGGQIHRPIAVPPMIDVRIEDALHPMAQGLAAIGMGMIPHVDVGAPLPHPPQKAVEAAVAFGYATIPAEGQFFPEKS